MKATIAKIWPLALLVVIVVVVAGCAATGPGGAAAGGVAGGALAVLLTVLGAAAGGLATSGCTNLAGRACEIDADDDGACADEDCNDADPNVHPGADEARCADGVDQDCDGTDVLDVTRCTMPPMTMNTCTDADGDGYGMGFCPGPDCDDSDPTVFPGAIDSACDDVDSDCDPTGPEVTCNPLPEDVCCDHIDGDGDGRDDPIGAACNCCYDDDGDGHGVGLCASFDCNDGDASIHPGAIDVSCDEIDSDCDPTGPEISCTVPEEHCCDGIDSDGDGQDDPRGVACNCCYDADGDGFGDAACRGLQTDCDDSDPSVFPGNTQESSPAAPDVWMWCSDGKDNDCDGAIDYLDPQCPILNGMLDEAPAETPDAERVWPPSDESDDGSNRPA